MSTRRPNGLDDETQSPSTGDRPRLYCASINVFTLEQCARSAFLRLDSTLADSCCRRYVRGRDTRDVTWCEDRAVDLRSAGHHRLGDQRFSQGHDPQR